MGFFFNPGERTGSWQGGVEVVDAEKQEKAIARRGNVGTRQRWMFIMGIPFVETEQDRPVPMLVDRLLNDGCNTSALMH